MAMKICPDCGEKYSDTYKRCPFCEEEAAMGRRGGGRQRGGHRVSQRDPGVLSPLLIIVVAISGLGSYAVPSFPLTLSLRIAQFFLVVAAGIAGYLGVVLGCFYLLIRMAGITSLGCPYFAPIAPKRPSNPDAVLRMPIWRQRLRGFMANPFQLRRTDGRMRAWDREDK